MKDKLEKLKGELAKAQKPEKASARDRLEPKTPVGRVFTVGVDLVAGVIVGVFLGVLIDWQFNTSPWGLIILFVLGSAAGMLNVYRTLTKDQGSKNKTGNKDG